MRDHRTRSEQLQARLRLTRRRVPEVGRVLLLRRAAPARSVPGINSSVHLTFAYSIGAPRVALHHHGYSASRSTPAGPAGAAAPVSVGRAVFTAPSGPAPRVTQRSVVRVVTADQRGRSADSPERAVLARAAVRLEAPPGSARVMDVQRVVARPTGANATSAGAVAPASGSEWPPRTPRLAESAQRTVPVSASPAELASITDSVMTAIDQRLIAYGERLGRG